jgi:LVIVD repeat
MRSLSHFFALPLTTGLSLAYARPQLPINLVSAYTPGEQLCLEVTPDGRRGFLALGATIAILDFEGVTQLQAPVQFDKHQVPECQPLSMRYYHEAASGGNPAADYLFIAGGALGVWRLSLCSGIFNPSPQAPQACPGTSYADLLVQAPIETGPNFERKRCVDVEVLETAAGPRLFALFASSSEHPTQSLSSTELREYSWNSQSATQVAAFTFRDTTPPAPPEVGTSLAVDPADHDSIYVGLGKGGIWRADITGGTLSAAQVWSTATSCVGGTYPIQHVRDLAIVQVASPAQSVLFAALNYDELLEITYLGGGAAQACTIQPLKDAGYAESIAALTTQGTNVWVAVVGQTAEGKGDDMRPPHSVNGAWVGLCLTGIGDPDAPPISGASCNIQLYQHDFATPGSLLTGRQSIGYPSSFAELGSHSAILQNTAGGSMGRLFHCSRWGGTELYDFNLSSGVASAAALPFFGEAFRGQDSVVASVNPGVALFIQEGAGAIAWPKEMVYIDPAAPYWITPVPQTEHSPCVNGYTQPPGCAFIGPIEPGLYQASILGEAHWPDPQVPGREYFLPGRKVWERYSIGPTAPCAVLPDCGFPYDPCDQFTGDPNWDLRKPPDPPAPLPPNNRSAWRLISLLLPGTGMPPNGPSMQAKTWLFDNPKALAPYNPEETTTPTDDRMQSVADARTSNNLPTVVYLTKSGSSYGVKVLKATDIVDTANVYCSGLGGVGGNGELLPAGSLAFRTTLTHLELELNPIWGECVPITPCQAQSSPPEYLDGAHQLFNDHSDLYKTRDLTGAPMWVLAVASGFPSSYDGIGNQFFPGGQTAGCQWKAYAGQPMLVLLDVTRSGDGVNFTDPTVLRVALGTGQGNAFCVRTQIVGRKAYAYVGDIQGKIAVFDVSGSNVLPPPTLPYASVPAQFLEPKVEIQMPRDPVDGLPANCIDMEIVGDYLYVGLARLGVAIIHISDPTHPELQGVIDTPGLVMGLSQRTVPGGTQLIVGDSRCGIRVYQ